MIVIIDYGLGNLASIGNMLKKIGVEAIISSDKDAIARADKLVLPGVGAFDVGMRNLIDRDLITILHEQVLEERTPILGICLGLQLFGTESAEGTRPGLGWIDARSIPFHSPPAGPSRVPHMGWNNLHPRTTSPLWTTFLRIPDFTLCIPTILNATILRMLLRLRNMATSSHQLWPVKMFWGRNSILKKAIGLEPA